MSNTLTPAEICFCFDEKLIFKLPDFIFLKHVPPEKKNNLNKYWKLKNTPDLLNNIEKSTIVEELKGDISWSNIAEFISVSPDSLFQIEELWKHGENRLGKYSIEIRYTEIPDRVYCYMDDNVEYLKPLFENNQLYLSSPQKFRDPFDCSLDENIFNTFKDKAIRCFSAEYDNILMYSHYANKHYGLCVCFESEKLKESMSTAGDPKLEASIRPVFYFNVMPSFELEKEPVYCATCKHDVWSYEKEYRLFMVENGHKLHSVHSDGLYDYNSESIKAIYYGCSASDEFIETVKAMTKYLSADSYFKARRVPNKFGITFYPI